MPIKYVASVMGIFALCAAVDPAPAAAQPVNCADMYRQVMALYQTAPLSPQYNQMAARYAASCLRGASLAPAYPTPYSATAPAPVPYPYPAPAPYYGYAPAAYPYYGYDYSYDPYGYYGVPVGIGFGFGYGFRGGFHGGGL
jgi:hypothetical protein